MPVPPKGDPQRPIELAIRSTRTLGYVSAVFGLVMMVAFGYFNRYPRFRPYFIGMGLLVWFIPGVLFLTASHFLRRRSRAAIVGAMATTAGQMVFAGALLVGTVTVEPVSPVPVILTALWVAALVQLMAHLRASFESVRVDAEHVRGFEAVGAGTPRRVLAVEPGDAGSAETAGKPAG